METTEIQGSGEAAVEAMAERLAHAPDLADLSPEELAAVARAALGFRLVNKMNRRADLAGIDYAQERAAFLAQAGRTGSEATRRTYAAALDRLEEWTRREGARLFDLSTKDADTWAVDLLGERKKDGAGLSSATIRKTIAAASSFYSFLERRYTAIRNPFRGSKARPAKKAARKLEIPEPEELEKILEELKPAPRAAAVLMYRRGLRVGALPSLAIRAGRFTATTKGKGQAGEMPAEALAAIAAAELDTRAPFAGWNAQRLADAFRYATKSLHARGEIRAAYSVHDLRHAYAVAEYRKDRDIYRVSRLLGHASIQVTETYLRGLGEID